MAQQVINVGSEFNDPTADRIRPALGEKVNPNFTELYAFMANSTKVRERFIPFIASNNPVLTQVVNSINASTPQTVVPNGVLQLFSFIQWQGGVFGTEFVKTVYALKTGAGTYGSGGTTLNPSDVILINVQNTVGTVIPCGDIGSNTIEDFVNGSGPYVITGLTIFTATISGVDKVYVFSGANGTYGDGATQTTSDNFIDVSGQNIPSVGLNAFALRFISLDGVDTEQEELFWVAEAAALSATNLYGGTITCNQGEQIVFFCDLVSGSGVQRRFYALNSGATAFTGVTSPYLDLTPLGVLNFSLTDNPLVVDLGDIGATAVQTAFNADASEPFEMNNDRFIIAETSGGDKVWKWIGGSGSFGDSETPAVAGDFVDLTAQPEVSGGSELLGAVKRTGTPYTLTYQDLNRFVQLTSNDVTVNIADTIVELAANVGIFSITGRLKFEGTGEHTVNFPTAQSKTFAEGDIVVYERGVDDGEWDVWKDDNDLTEVTITTPVGRRLSPKKTNITGFYTRRNTNGRQGYESFNQSTGNNASSAFVAGTGSNETSNVISIQHFASAFFNSILRNRGAIFSDNNTFHLIQKSGGGEWEFRTGSNVFTDIPKVFKIWGSKRVIEIVPIDISTLTGLLAGMIGFDSENDNRPTTYNGTAWKGLAYTDEIPTTPTLDEVLGEGNSSEKEVILNGGLLKFGGLLDGSGADIEKTSEGIQIILDSATDQKTINLYSESQTFPRDFTFPDEDGTLATIEQFTDAPTEAATSLIGLNGDGEVVQGNHINESIKLGSGTFSDDDSLLLINRLLTAGGGTSGFHALRDETVYNTEATSGLRSYASFDAIPQYLGGANYGHFHGFQSRLDYAGSGTITAIRHHTAQTTHTGTGIVNSNYGYYVADALGSGPITNNVGLLIEPLTRGGTSNFAIYTAGTTQSYFGGRVTFNNDVVALGVVSGSNIFQSVGQAVTSVGYLAGRDVNIFSGTLFGHRAGAEITTFRNKVTVVGASGSKNPGSDSTFVGAFAGFNSTGTGIVGIGHQAGYWETTNNKLFIDNRLRNDQGDARIKSLIYGQFDDLVENQFLTINGRLNVNGSAKVANDTTAASATNAGSIRYRTDANNSYLDVSMQTGASTYAWVNIQINTW